MAVAIQQEGIQNAPALPGVRGAAETGKEEWRVERWLKIASISLFFPRRKILP